MVDKTGWTEPLDSARSGLEFVRSVRWGARVAAKLAGSRWPLMVGDDDRVARIRGGFDYGRSAEEGQRSGVG